MDLYNKVILITGGARMGLAIGQILGQRGARLIYTYRKSKASAEETVDILRQRAISCTAMPCDVSDSKSIHRLFQQIQKTEKRLDGIVHLASIYEKIDVLDPQAGASLESHWKAHVQSSFDLGQTFFPLLKRSGSGRLIFISDWTAASGRPRYKGYTPYYISKVGVRGVVESLALEFAPHVLVNGIAPGPILPPPGLSKREIQAVSQATPLKRWGGAAEIAKTVLFLMQTDYVTGETIRVDGGRHLD